MLPFNVIKIDKSFIMNITSEEKSMALVKAILNMARSLSIRVVAECVETEKQYSTLKELGCDLI